MTYAVFSCSIDPALPGTVISFTELVRSDISFRILWLVMPHNATDSAKGDTQDTVLWNSYVLMIHLLMR